MSAAFLITLREGLEAALIVSIVLAHLRKQGRNDQFTIVFGGAIAGAVVALIAGVGVYLAIGELEGRAEQFTESIISLVAVGALTWMIFWMRQQARTIGGALRGRVDHALASGAVLGMASIAFIGVLRDGLETALFMLAVVFDFGVLSTAIGAFAGLATAIALGYGIYRGGQLINLRLFFQATGGLVILVAAGLFGRGVYGLQALGVFESMHRPLWNLGSNPIVGHGQFAAFLKGIFGWSAEPSVEQVIVWIGYVATASWFFYFGRLPDALSRRAEQWRSTIVRSFAGLLGKPPVVASAEKLVERE